jgi:hypothetical protein
MLEKDVAEKLLTVLLGIVLCWTNSQQMYVIVLTCPLQKELGLTKNDGQVLDYSLGVLRYALEEEVGWGRKLRLVPSTFHASGTSPAWKF